MKKIFVFLLVCLSETCFSQACIERTFNTTLTYSNAELGKNYVNEPYSGVYGVFHRTNESVNTSCGVLDIKKPIIICEGFDIFHREGPQDIYDHYLGNYGSQLRAQGYDIITYNLNVPQAAIQPNALLFAQFVDFINKNKTGTEENIIMGVSMGGILARYALAYMEKNDIPHNTHLYVSFDSPHKGANVPLSMQALSFDNSAYSFIAALAGFNYELAYIYQALISQGSQQLITDYIMKISNKKSGPHPLHTSFFNELRSMNDGLGYPQNCKKIAISNGSYKSDLQVPLTSAGAIPGNPAIILGLPASIFTKIWALRSAPGDDYDWGFVYNDEDVCVLSHFRDCDIVDESGNVRYQVKHNGRPLDHSPGGYYPWFKEIKDNTAGTSIQILAHNNDNACFIPTISSLDICTNDKLLNLKNYGYANILSNTPFDDIWWDVKQENLLHTDLPETKDGIGDWLKKNLSASPENYSGEYDKVVSDKTFSQNTVYKAVNSVTFTGVNKVTSGSAVIVKTGTFVDILDDFEIDASSGAELNISIEPVKASKKSLACNLPNYTSAANRMGDDFVQNTVIDTIINGFAYKLPKPEKLEVANSGVVYPNPCKKELNIDLSGEPTQDMRFVILNGLGEVVFEQEQVSQPENKFFINLPSMVSGVYAFFAKGSKGFNKAFKINIIQ